LIKVIGSILIVASCTAVTMSLISYRHSHWLEASIRTLNSLLLLTCSVGYRFMQRWSVYLFTLFLAVAGSSYALTVVAGVLPAYSTLGVAGLIIILFYGPVALHWRSFRAPNQGVQGTPAGAGAPDA
jgi:hypothetical protein